MASRSRFQQLKDFRDNAKELRQGLWEPPPASDVATSAHTDPSVLDLNVRKLGSRTDSHDTRIDIPPQWSVLADKSNHVIKEISLKLDELKKLQQQHLLPGFGDATKQDKKLEQSTKEISTMIHQCHATIKKIGLIASNAPEHSQESRLCVNIQMGLARKLQQVTSDFKRIQSDYLRQLQALEERQPTSAAAFTLSDDEKRRLQVALSDEESQDSTAPFSMLTAAQQQQQLSIQTTERQSKERHQAMREIVQSVVDLADMVQQCHSLIIEQGTTLDRIDHHVEMASMTVQQGLVQLQETEEQQRTGFIATCIRVELAIIAFLILMLTLKLLFRLVQSHR